jgi:hypothetical protein
MATNAQDDRDGAGASGASRPTQGTEIDFEELRAQAQAKAERLYAEWLATGEPMHRI